ncbi:hypothetical protein BGZ65_005123, partial [Modicella reniformis]
MALKFGTNHFKAALTPAHKWTPDLVSKFGVRFRDHNVSEILMRRDCLPESTRMFLDESVAAIRREDISNQYFKLLDHLRKNNIEKFVDPVLGELLRKSMPDHRLRVHEQHVLFMEMSGKEQQVRPDLSISMKNGSVQALMVVEAKRATKDIPTEAMMNRTRSQVVAQAIAANQQEAWPRNLPVFMMICVGTKVLFYKAVFNDQLLRRVRKGVEFRGMDCEQTEVMSYAKTMDYGRPVPWDISSIDDLPDVIGVLGHIHADYLWSRTTMTLVTEFRPVSHEFYPDSSSRAGFIGASSTDALWFYRFDSSFVEVRDVFTCQDKVFASLSTTEVKQRFRDLLKGNEIRFVIVQDIYVADFHVLLIVVRESQEDRDHVFFWNLLTLHLQLLVSASRLLTAATVTAQKATTRYDNDGTSPIDMDDDDDDDDDDDNENEDEDEEDSQNPMWLQGNRRHLLVLGHRNHWMSIYKFTVSLTGKDPEHETSINNKPGSVGLRARVHRLDQVEHQSHGMGIERAGFVPAIAVGTSEAQVYVVQYYDARENKKPNVMIALEDLKTKLLPITSITLQHTTDRALDLLVIGQGYRADTLDCGESPTVTIYHLHHQEVGYKLLGYVQPPMLEGEVASRGETLAATVSEDANGLRVHCAFSVQVDQGPVRSNLTTVEINNKVQSMDVVELTTTEGGTLWDISSQSNSYELSLLYLGKIVNYVNAADKECSRKESEWGEGEEAAYRHPAPVYGSFVDEQKRFSDTGYGDVELAEIELRRQQLGGKLFYDRLLEFIDLDVGVLYPPRNHNQQRNLWTNIYVNGSLNTDNRNCLAYYLLKNQHSNASEKFLNEYLIPTKFVDLMNGFWALDHFEFKSAVLYLSRPELTVDWIEDVAEAIFKHGSAQLARHFILAGNLNLNSDPFVDLKLQILLATDFTEAFNFQRSSTVSTRTPKSDTNMDVDVEMMAVDLVARKERLFKALLNYCFQNKPNRKAIKALALLTLNEAEEQMFIRYCDEHAGVTREVGHEFLIMYYVNHSRYIEAIRMHRKRLSDEIGKEGAEEFRPYNIHSSGESSSQAKDLKRPLSKSEKRQVIIDSLMMVLPPTQREILELEKGQFTDDDSTGADGGSMISSATTTKELILSLMKEVGEPLTSLKGLDLDWVAKSLTRHVLEEEFEQD